MPKAKVKVVVKIVLPDASGQGKAIKRLDRRVSSLLERMDRQMAEESVSREDLLRAVKDAAEATNRLGVRVNTRIGDLQSSIEARDAALAESRSASETKDRINAALIAEIERIRTEEALEDEATDRLLADARAEAERAKTAEEEARARVEAFARLDGEAFRELGAIKQNLDTLLADPAAPVDVPQVNQPIPPPSVLVPEPVVEEPSAPSEPLPPPEPNPSTGETPPAPSAPETPGAPSNEPEPTPSTPEPAPVAEETPTEPVNTTPPAEEPPTPTPTEPTGEPTPPTAPTGEGEPETPVVGSGEPLPAETAPDAGAPVGQIGEAVEPGEPTADAGENVGDAGAVSSTPSDASTPGGEAAMPGEGETVETPAATTRRSRRSSS